jgi:hypothetical protein
VSSPRVAADQLQLPQASANLFSLATTCRASDVDRFEYFSYIFEYLPMATTMEALEALLLWNVLAVTVPAFGSNDGVTGMLKVVS